MKKLFSIFCCLLLSASMVTQAQLLNAIKDSIENVVTSQDEYKRNNAPVASQTDYSQYFTIDEIITHEHGKDNGNGYWYYRTNANHIIARKANGDIVELYFGRTSDQYYMNYDGIIGPEEGTYPLYMSQSLYDVDNNNVFYTDDNVWVAPAADAVWVYNTGTRCYNKQYYPAYDLWICAKTINIETWRWSGIVINGKLFKIRGGNITVEANNEGEIFIETHGVKDYNLSNNVYFTIGNRSKNTINLGSGTMAISPTQLAMYATDGSSSAQIRINNNATGTYSLSDLDLTGTFFNYEGTDILSVSNITAQVSATNGVYTVVMTIRDSEQNVYIVTMSASAPTYTIKYKDKGGADFSGMQVNAPTTHTFGTATTLKIPTKTGYAFGGWYTASDCASGAVGNATSASLGATAYTADITLYALWTQKTYTLSATTNPDGLGTVTISPTAPYHYLDEVTLTAPEVTGYTFSGWGGTNSSMMSGNVFTFSADTANNTAYAVTANYTANPYTITLNNQDATEGGTSSQTVDYRTALPDITVPTKTGNAFGGYYTETNGGGTMLIGTDGKWVKNVIGYTDASGNLIHADNFKLFAKWTELVIFTIASYSNGTVTVTPNDGSGAFTSGSRSLAVGTRVDFSAVEDEHYHISTVNLRIKESDNSFSASSAYTLQSGDGTVTLTADFLPDTYAITYNAGENGTGADIDAGEKTYNEDFTLSSNTFTREGYTQTGWSINADGNSNDYTLGGTYTGNTALDLYPYWEVNSYSLNWTTDGDALTGTYTSGSTAYGTTIVQPNTPTKTGYTFVAWSPTPDATMPASPTTYTAQWNANTYNIFYKDQNNAAYSGSNESSLPDVHTYNVATDLEDGEKAGYNFLGWFTDAECTASAGTSIAANSITADITLYAKWELAATPEIELNEDGSQHLDNTVPVTSENPLSALATKYASRDVNVTLNRQLYGGSWNTICFPFGLEDLDVEGNELYDILRNSLYELQPSTTTATADGMIINFLPLSYEEGVIPLKAGVPYLIRTSADIDLADYKFENVRLNPATNPVLKKEGVDLDVQFVPVMTRTLLTSKKDIVVVGSRLYYPNQSGGSYLRAFRAYLHITNGAESNYVQPRIRIVDTGEIIALEEEQEVETRKYIEDGILIIERGGVRYDAQGKRME